MGTNASPLAARRRRCTVATFASFTTLAVVVASVGRCEAAAPPSPPPAADGPNSLGFELRFLDTGKHPTAVCNDGTPAAYYFRKGADPTRWVLHQQGGWWCWDEYSCQVRWEHFSNHTSEERTLMSTAQLAALTAEHDTFNGEKNTGVMTNSTLNPLANATKIFLVYCSSDAHAGNRSAGELAGAGASRWHFRGKDIVTAVISDLADNDGLSGAASFVLTGGSAGGMATINNADYVGGLVRAVAPSARYVAMPDSGYFMDVSPGQMCSSSGTYECLCAAGANASAGGTDGWTQVGGHSWLGRGQTLAQQAQAMRVFSQGVVDKSCSEHYGGRWGDWRCYLGQYAAPHLDTPTLFLQNQIDEWQGFWNGFFNYTRSSEAYEYAAWFRQACAGEMRANIAASPRAHFFAPNCYHHGLSYDSIFWQVTVQAGGVAWTSAAMLDALLSGAAPPQLVLDGCDGLPCSPATTGHADCETVPPPPPHVG